MGLWGVGERGGGMLGKFTEVNILHINLIKTEKLHSFALITNELKSHEMFRFS